MDQNRLIETANKSSFTRNNCCTLAGNVSGSQPELSNKHADLAFSEHEEKVPKDGNPDKFFKVVIAPIILFTDDTSGGTSKQHLPYESWSMTYAALSFEDRGRRENTMFIGCAPKNDGVKCYALHSRDGCQPEEA